MKKLPCNTPLLLTRHLHDVNGEFGAKHLTQSTGNAALGIAHLGRVVSLGIKKAGHLQSVPRAIVHAQLAALAALNDDVNLATRHDDAVLIKGFTPKSHGYLLLTRPSAIGFQPSLASQRPMAEGQPLSAND
jgi:hypothetical protein